MKKLYLCLMLVVVFSLLACSKGGNATIKQLENNNELVYVNENGQYMPFIVLKNNYNEGSTLLLRQYVLNEKKAVNDYASYYEDCLIDKYLNEEYIKAFTDISIKDTNILITSDDAIGVSGDENYPLTRKIFLLSGSEIGLNPGDNLANEGEKLSFFDNPENRLAVTFSNSPSEWWLRSANTAYTMSVYRIGSDGKIGNGNASDDCGIRPAFCIDSNTPVEISSIDGQQAYVIK